MIEISKEEIGDKMFFIREENSNQPIAVVKVSDLMKYERLPDDITEEDIQNAIRAGYENGYSMAQAKYQRPQGEWIKNVIELFNKYDVLLVPEGGQIVPVKNTTKQDCYDLLYEIQELIEWRKILFNKNLNDVYKEGEQNV